MEAFLYGVGLQWKLDIRSKTLLITCYLVPLAFYLIMGGIFTTIMPEAKATLIQSMSVFGITMGALIGLPPSLVEIYSSDIKKVYHANGVPLYLGLVLTNISAFIHLSLMSLILYVTAPLIFDAQLPRFPLIYLCSLFVFIAVSLSVASIIGLAVKDQAKTSMFSMFFFLPSIMLSGIMFPIELLPQSFETLGKFFPASWGYRLMSGAIEDLVPLFMMFIFSVIICFFLLKKVNK